jgi:hypothetical protein
MIGSLEAGIHMDAESFVKKVRGIVPSLLRAWRNSVEIHEIA